MYTVYRPLISCLFHYESQATKILYDDFALAFGLDHWVASSKMNRDRIQVRHFPSVPFLYVLKIQQKSTRPMTMARRIVAVLRYEMVIDW